MPSDRERHPGRPELGTDVVVPDSGQGTALGRARFASRRAGAEVTPTSDSPDSPSTLIRAGGEFAGVGAYAARMQGLRAIKRRPDHRAATVMRRTSSAPASASAWQVLFARGVERARRSRPRAATVAGVRRAICRAPVVPRYHGLEHRLTCRRSPRCSARVRGGQRRPRPFVRRTRLDAGHQRPHPRPAGGRGPEHRGRSVRGSRGERSLCPPPSSARRSPGDAGAGVVAATGSSFAGLRRAVGRRRPPVAWAVRRVPADHRKPSGLNPARGRRCPPASGRHDDTPGVRRCSKPAVGAE